MKIILLLVLPATLAAFPKNFKKCYRKDKDFDKCAQNAAQDGIRQLTKSFPEWGIVNTSPLEVSEVFIGAGSKNIIALDQVYTNCKLYGIATTTLKSFKFDFLRRNVYLVGVTPSLEQHCHYRVNGTVLHIKAEGEGPSSIVLENAVLILNLSWFEKKKRKGTFMTFVTNSLSIDAENATLRFDNLFNGDKALTENVNIVINENWREIYKDVRKYYEQAYGILMQHLINGFFSRVSMEAAFD